MKSEACYLSRTTCRLRMVVSPYDLFELAYSALPTRIRPILPRRPAEGGRPPQHESRSAWADAPSCLTPCFQLHACGSADQQRERRDEIDDNDALFFDFRSDGAFSADDEGLDLLDADAAHQ
jgi:hypothetical protein